MLIHNIFLHFHSSQFEAATVFNVVLYKSACQLVKGKPTQQVENNTKDQQQKSVFRNKVEKRKTNRKKNSKKPTENDKQAQRKQNVKN